MKESAAAASVSKSPNSNMSSFSYSHSRDGKPREYNMNIKQKPPLSYPIKDPNTNKILAHHHPVAAFNNLDFLNKEQKATCSLCDEINRYMEDAILNKGLQANAKLLNNKTKERNIKKIKKCIKVLDKEIKRRIDDVKHHYNKNHKGLGKGKDGKDKEWPATLSFETLSMWPKTKTQLFGSKYNIEEPLASDPEKNNATWSHVSVINILFERTNKCRKALPFIERAKNPKPTKSATSVSAAAATSEEMGQPATWEKEEATMTSQGAELLAAARQGNQTTQLPQQTTVMSKKDQRAAKKAAKKAAKDASGGTKRKNKRHKTKKRKTNKHKTKKRRGTRRH